jgi:hypothetical protein
MATTFYAGQKLRASRLAQLANVDVFASLGGCSLTLTSATYVNITNASKSFTKLGGATDSDLVVQASLSAWSSATATIIKIGVNVNSADTDAITFPFNTASVHTTSPDGIARITGLAAGAYTVQLRALRVSGAGTVTIDTQDTVSMTIREQVI